LATEEAADKLPLEIGNGPEVIEAHRRHV